MKITIDTDFIFGLKDAFEPEHESIIKIVKQTNESAIDLGIPNSVIAEIWPDRNRGNIEEKHFRDYDIFVSYLSDLGIRKFTLLETIPYIGFILNKCIAAERVELTLEEDIHKILWGNKYPLQWEEASYLSDKQKNMKKWKNKWLNPKCDVTSFWCHIYYKRDVFITTDKNFLLYKNVQLKKKFEGVNICTPTEFLNKIRGD